MRTITEICKDADLYENDLDKLEDLRKEILVNIYNYSLVELRFMNEYLREKVSKYAKQTVFEIKEFLNDWGLLNND